MLVLLIPSRLVTNVSSFHTRQKIRITTAAAKPRKNSGINVFLVSCLPPFPPTLVYSIGLMRNGLVLLFFQHSRFFRLVTATDRNRACCILRNQNYHSYERTSYHSQHLLSFITFTIIVHDVLNIAVTIQDPVTTEFKNCTLAQYNFSFQ